MKKTITIEIIDGDGASLGEDGATVTITGVVWNDKHIYTDMAHIKVK